MSKVEEKQERSNEFFLSSKGSLLRQLEMIKERLNGGKVVIKCGLRKCNDLHELLAALEKNVNVKYGKLEHKDVIAENGRKYTDVFLEVSKTK
jgi:hypothetical protein